MSIFKPMISSVMFKVSSHILTLLLVVVAPICNAQSNAGSETLIDTFDFVPRTHVFFSDDFSQYPTGRLPAERYIVKCECPDGSILVKKSEHYSWLYCYTHCAPYSIKPILNNTDLIRDSFTIELDYAFASATLAPDKSWHFVYFHLLNPTDTSLAYITVNKDGECSFGHTCPGREKYNREPTVISSHIAKFDGRGWHHLAISYQTGNVSIFIDKHRLVAYSGCSIFPSEFRIGGRDAFKIRNLKMATGPLERPFSDIITQDKLVTHAINFEVNKAAIALSGKRYLKELANFLSEHTDIKLEISGHTDNDGTPENNLKLSQARANAVKKHLTLLGIDESRLTTKGYGESRPLKPNSSPEGKQENRRVEFRKIRMP